MQEIITQSISYAGYAVAFLSAAEIIGAFFLPGSIMAKIPTAIRFVRMAVKSVEVFKQQMDQWEKERGGFSREPDPKIKQ